MPYHMKTRPKYTRPNDDVAAQPPQHQDLVAERERRRLEQRQRKQARKGM